MNLSVVIHLLLVLFLQSTEASPTQIRHPIFEHTGVNVPDREYWDEISHNPLLKWDELSLPMFNEITSENLIAALKCAEAFYKNNIGEVEDNGGTFKSVIELPKHYINSIKHILYLNNFKEEIQEIDNEQDVQEEYQLLNQYREIADKYDYELAQQRNEYFLSVKKKHFINPEEIPPRYWKSWWKLAKKINKQHDLRVKRKRKKKLWYLPYKDFEYVMEQPKKSKSLKKKLSTIINLNEQNDQVILQLRTLYENYARENLGYNNIVEYKISSCYANNYESVYEFLKKVEKSFGDNIKSDPNWEIKKETIDKKFAGFFPRRLAMTVLFERIFYLFHIDIRQPQFEYPKFADTMKLYEVYEYDVLIGLFYIDDFERPRKKHMPAYTQALRYNVGVRDVLPLVFISLQTKSEEEITLSELRSLFHQMGHCLQIILTEKSKLIEQYDTREFPSMFMEHVAMQRDTIRRISAELLISDNDYDLHYKDDLLRWYKYEIVKNIQSQIIDLNIFKNTVESNTKEMIESIQNQFTFQELHEKTYLSGLPEFNYAGTTYTYLLSEIMAIHAYQHMHRNPNIIMERKDLFRKLVFNREDAPTLHDAYRLFVDADQRIIDLKPFYEFYGIEEYDRFMDI